MRREFEYVALIGLIILSILNGCSSVDFLKSRTVEESIENLNNTFNEIKKEEILYRFEDILTGEAFEEFEEIKEIINGSKDSNSQYSVYRSKVDEYTRFAENLKIKIEDVDIIGEEGEARVIFYNSEYITEDKKILYLRKEGENWKVKRIEDRGDGGDGGDRDMKEK